MNVSLPITELMNGLPFHVQLEVRDFIEFLRTKHVCQSQKRLRQDWAGGLSKYRNQYTALELQNQALEWRND